MTGVGRATGRAIAIGAWLLMAAPACVPSARRQDFARPAPRIATSAELLAEARGRGLPATDPLVLDADMKAEIDQVVGRTGTPEERLKRLLRFINDQLFIDFQYAPDQSLTAREAYRARRGDCVAYTHLFVAMARHLDVPVYFVYVREVEGHYRRGSYYLSSHVAIGHGHGPDAMVMDLSQQAPDWALSIYNAIDDGTALALYYNNLAVDAMTSGRTGLAERMLRFWLTRRPNVVELYNNLGVLLNRQRRHAEALAVLEAGIAGAPSYTPLYTNAITAAHGVGDQKRALRLVNRAALAGKDDPLLLLVSGMTLAEEGDLAGATERLEQAEDALPESPVIHAWLVRVYLASGRIADGRRALTRLRALDTNGRILGELMRDLPEAGAL